MRLTVVAALLLATAAHAQTYEQALDACTRTFEARLNYSDLRKKMEDLHACINGNTLPDFAVTSLSGRKYTRADFQGKVVMINLWFIHCRPCVEELPLLNELNAEFSGKDFLLLSFATDSSTQMRKFLKLHPLSYDVVTDATDLINRKFKMTFGYPNTIFLDKQGKIIEFVTGGLAGEEGLRKTKADYKAILTKALAEEFKIKN